VSKEKLLGAFKWGGLGLLAIAGIVLVTTAVLAKEIVKEAMKD